MAYPAKFKRKLRDAFIRGEGSLYVLSKKFKVRLNTVRKWAKVGDWENLKEEAEKEALKKSQKTNVEKIAEHNAQMKGAMDALLHLSMKCMQVENKKSKGPRSDVIVRLTRAIRHIQDGQRIALGAELLEDVTDTEIKVIYEPIGDKVRRERAEEEKKKAEKQLEEDPANSEEPPEEEE